MSADPPARCPFCLDQLDQPVTDPEAPSGTRMYRLEPAPATGADTDGDGDVDFDDLLAVLSGWTTP